MTGPSNVGKNTPQWVQAIKPRGDSQAKDTSVPASKNESTAAKAATFATNWLSGGVDPTLSRSSQASRIQQNTSRYKFPASGEKGKYATPSSLIAMSGTNGPEGPARALGQGEPGSMKVGDGHLPVYLQRARSPSSEANRPPSNDDGNEDKGKGPMRPRASYASDGASTAPSQASEESPVPSESSRAEASTAPSQASEESPVASESSRAEASTAPSQASEKSTVASESSRAAASTAPSTAERAENVSEVGVSYKTSFSHMKGGGKLFKEKLEKLESYKKGLGEGSQTKNANEVRKKILSQFNAIFKISERKVILDDDSSTEKQRGIKWENNKITKGIKVDGTKVVSKKQLQIQKNQTKVRIMKGKINADTVKYAISNGVIEIAKDGETNFCLLSSPIYLFRDGNLGKKVGTQKVMGYQMSAPKAYEIPYKSHDKFEAELYKKDIGEQLHFFADSAVRDGCKTLICSGFGQGSFTASLSPDERVQSDEIFAKCFADVVEKNQMVDVVFCDNRPELINSIKKKLENKGLQDKVFFTGKMAMDVARVASEEKMTGEVALLIAGDPSLQSGQYFRSDNPETMQNIAQEEQIACGSTSALMSHFAQDAEIEEVSLLIV